MKPLLSLFCPYLLIVLVFPCLAAEPGELDGTWIEAPYRPSRAEHPGYLPPSDPATLVIEGHMLTMKSGDQVFRQSLINFAGGEGVRAADLTTVVGGEFWLTRAIYKLEGDTLTLC